MTEQLTDIAKEAQFDRSSEGGSSNDLADVSLKSESFTPSDTTTTTASSPASAGDEIKYSLEAAAGLLLNDSKRAPLQITEAHAKVDDVCREAQNALRAALQSSLDAINAGSLQNRIQKVSSNKKLKGNWSGASQDSLRAAILFAGAGLDRTVKLLAESAIPKLLHKADESVGVQFAKFAEKAVSDVNSQTVSARMFVSLLLEDGQTPREVLMNNWIRELTGSSAQSSSRVSEIATALGVSDKTFRMRCSDSKRGSDLNRAFHARNQVAHELDVTKPKLETRQPLERIRATRTVVETEGHVREMLDVAQQLVNLVVVRVVDVRP
ncbi:hypothetical protein EDF36_3545 [Rathayibacter sp. PhB152]|uniref:hypothetical protein n=1 Tax=Rathayibacter sp. PhB152 TaxID=2485190 RepID=UPI000FB1E15A|nr:hypothetical protein [Rathayibacter sp. PhB152]ROQ54491.1 hypothetical protein EDF36_3545 [Rathayibacter sp. PhB152]